MGSRVTEIAVEAITTGDPDARVTALPVEAFNTGDPAGRVTAVPVEAFNTGAPAARGGAVSVEAFNTGAPQARVTAVAVDVWRSIRDAPYPHFPVRLFCPPTFGVRLQGGAVFGPRSPGFDQAVAAMDAGGRWVCEFGEAPLWSREKVLAWRQFSTATDGGAMPAIVPVWDRLYQPFEAAAYTGATTFGQVVWRDTIAWEAEAVQAALTVTAEQRATELTFSFEGGELLGGEHFSIYGPRFGWRLYRLVRIVEAAEDLVTAEIRPPLREWAGAGQPLNFDSPRCTMRPEGDMSEVVEMLRFGRGAVRFVESFSRYP